ncbi:15-hydroxyprostaglandin dehydrogenase [NAD(+)]-like isoform X2 [Photinus pyralis]|uniref:15-hydroxyprostaglandin dehydrogenase n=1 Tax=Photinus pyralis TaxID=7054 RepID=A0A1Y1K7K7_PHOPY|nr:15-hydroxyprostaglandin dehydrogenase [NAD(+)]-like isoform X2 [Photinus pyralis]
MFELEGKVALITGGASGIGLATVKELLLNGLKAISVVDFNESAGQKVVEDVNKEYGANTAIFVKVDVGNAAEFRGAFEATIKKFNNLDIVINNAGILNEIDWEKMIKTNVNGTVNGCLLALEFLQRHRSTNEGVIVNIASISGLETYGHTPIYNATKHAVVGLSRSLGLHGHYDRTAVKILTVCPGCTQTQLLMGSMEGRLTQKQLELGAEVMKGYELQPIKHVAKEIIPIIRSGRSGSVWVVEYEAAYQVEMPHYSERRLAP